MSPDRDIIGSSRVQSSPQQVRIVGHPGARESLVQDYSLQFAAPVSAETPLIESLESPSDDYVTKRTNGKR